MHRFLGLWFLVMLATVLSAHSAQFASRPAQTVPSSDAALQRASELFDSGKYVDALPLLEQLSADHPQDDTVKGRWAVTMMAYATTLSDSDLQQESKGSRPLDCGRGSEGR